MQLYENILKIIFPETCEMCGKLGNIICNNCYNKLKKYEITNKRGNKFYLFKYEEEIRKLLINYKFKGRAYLNKLFSNLIIKNKNACDFIKSYDIIIPVPIHKKRMYERGYNQSELIVKRVAKELKIQDRVKTKILIKQKNTKPQSSISAKQRKENVKNVYTIKNSESIKNKKVLIFDDIITTGSTCNECKKELIKNHAKKVGIFVVARDYIK